MGVLAPDAEGKGGSEFGPLVRYYCYAAMLCCYAVAGNEDQN